MVKTKETNKSKKIAPRKKAALEILHHRLGQKSAISLMSVDTKNVWQDIELSICQNPFSHHVGYLQLIKRLGPKIH